MTASVVFMMDLNILYLLFIGYFVEFTSAGGSKKEKVHVKVHVPELIKHHHHTKIVFLHRKGGHKAKKKPILVVHKHEHNHKHKHDHGHKHGHKHGHNHQGKHGHKHDHKGHFKHDVKKTKSHDYHNYGWNHIGNHGQHRGHTDHKYQNYQKQPYKSYNPFPLTDDGYHKAVKATKSEHFEVESFDKTPREEPVTQHVVRGSYKVREYDPDDYTVSGFNKNYQYPPITQAQLHSANNKPFIPSQELNQISSLKDYDDHDTTLENDVDYDPSEQSEFENSDYSEYEDNDDPGYEDYFEEDYGGYGDGSTVEEKKAPS